MCVRLEVFLPTVDHFLYLYELKNGCIVICLWTMVRSLFCSLFFILAILEHLVKQKLPSGFLLPKPGDYADNKIIILYMLFLGMVIAEAFLLAGTFLLARALIASQPALLVGYLAIRALTWIAEVACLVALCFLEKLLIGWYLGFLFFVVLELYAWVVVYSYYTRFEEVDEKECDNCEEDDELGL